jgi:hypothetical protein
MDKTPAFPFILILFMILFVGCRYSALEVVEMTVTPSTVLTLTQETEASTETATPFAAHTYTSTPATSSTPAPTPTSNAYNPLTGQQVTDPALLDRRPVMIKISNFPPQKRPHSGLSFADMVFEHYIGEGTNRFSALYYGQDTIEAGPIRSGRLVDSQLVNMYAGILGYASADRYNTFVLKRDLGDRAISASQATCPALCNTGELNVFADTALLSQYSTQALGVNNIRYNLDGMVFGPLARNADADGNLVSVVFNAINIGEWRYDVETTSYLRWIEDVDESYNVEMIPLVDRLTGEQLAFSNVIILFAHYERLSPTRHEIDIWDNIDGRPMMLFREGKAYQGYWKTTPPDETSPISFFDVHNNNFLHLKPGNTWIVITGESSTLEEDLSGHWIMQFHLP